VFDKSFNQKANMEKVMGHIAKICRERKIWNYVVLHANNDEAAKWYAEQMETVTGFAPVSSVNISPIIGANTGIGAAAVAFMCE
jgi:uncharacterized protein